MAISIVQVANSPIETTSNHTVTFSPAPVEGNLMVVGLIYDTDRTIVLPPDETDGWTTRVAAATLGGDTGGRALRIDTATVGSGTDTSWFWDTTPNDVFMIMCAEISGADIGGTLKTDSLVDATNPMSCFVDGGSDPSGEMFYMVIAGAKEFGSRVVTFTNSDGSMTLQGTDSSEGGTNWAGAFWTEILDGTRPTSTITEDDTDPHTGTAQLIGIPVAAVTPSGLVIPRKQLTTVRM